MCNACSVQYYMYFNHTLVNVQCLFNVQCYMYCNHPLVNVLCLFSATRTSNDYVQRKGTLIMESDITFQQTGQ